MTAAIFGLLGVLVGGVLNGVVAAWLDSRNLSARRRVGARLVGSDVQSVMAVVHLLLEHSKWGASRQIDFPLAGWEAHRETLAEALEVDEWLDVDDAIRVIRIVLEVGQSKPSDQSLTPHDTEMVTAALGKLSRAADILIANL
jgi:hypothetical protein